MADIHAFVDRFVGYLEGLRDREDRGALAALRRGLGKPPGTVADMHPYVVPRLPPHAHRAEEDLYYLVASLFAYHDQPGGRGNMGRAFRGVRSATESESVEQRFVALLDCHRDDVADHLRQAIGLAKSNDVPVDYRRLLADLRYWDHPDRFIQRNWSRQFWGREQDQTASADQQ